MNKILKLAFACSAFLCSTNMMAQVKVHVSQPTVPVLTRKAYNPVLKMTLIKDTPLNCIVDKLSLSLDGQLNDIRSVGLYTAKADGKINPLDEILSTGHIENKMFFERPLILTQDTTIVWTSITLSDSINLTNKYCISCQEIIVDGKPLVIENVKPLELLRAGVAIRRHNQDNIHTSRIPGIATAVDGSLLAIYDARYEKSRDLQGNIDIAMNRSMDGGVTWGPTQIVLDMKNWGGLPEKYNGVSDACILVDNKNGDIYVAGLWMHGVLDKKTGKWVEGMTADSTRWIHQWHAKGSQPGLSVKETSQFLITKSTDNGLTWSAPINITSMAKRPEWWLYAPAPGHGIVLEDGTLVFPTQGRDKDGLPFSNITYSKDGGKTWKASNPAYNNTTECMAVQLSDGSVMLNMRDNRNHGNFDVNGRRICVTKNLGRTWVEHPTSRKALIEPTCMASIHKHVYVQNGKKKSLLLFCNPASYNKRNNMTLKVSFDDGKSWPSEYNILLDEWSGFGYSCITSIDENTIGILYEGSQSQMVFQQIKLSEILKADR